MAFDFDIIYVKGNTITYVDALSRLRFFMLVDSFLDWPEVIKLRDRKATTLRQILRRMFARNGVPKTIVTDKAPEF